MRTQPMRSDPNVNPVVATTATGVSSSPNVASPNLAGPQSHALPVKPEENEPTYGSGEVYGHEDELIDYEPDDLLDVPQSYE